MSDQERRALERVLRASGAEHDAVRLAAYDERLDGQAGLLQICFLRLMSLFSAQKHQKNYQGEATLDDIADILALTLGRISLGHGHVQIPFLLCSPLDGPYETSGIVSAYYSTNYTTDSPRPLGLFLDFSYVRVQAYNNAAHSYVSNLQYLIDHENYDGRRDPAVSPAEFYRASDGLEIKVSKTFYTHDAHGLPRREYFISARSDDKLRKYIAYRDDNSYGIVAVEHEQPLKPGVAFSQQSFPKLTDWSKLDLDYDLKRQILYMVVPHRLKLNIEYVQRWLMLYRHNYFY